MRGSGGTGEHAKPVPLLKRIHDKSIVSGYNNQTCTRSPRIEGGKDSSPQRFKGAEDEITKQPLTSCIRLGSLHQTVSVERGYGEHTPTAGIPTCLKPIAA